MMSDLAQRIRGRLEAVGLSANAASLQATGSASTIQNILNGRSTNPRVDTIEKLATVLKCRAEWLLTGAGEPGLDSPSPSDVSFAEDVRPPSRYDGPRDVPVLGTAAGSMLGNGAFQLVADVVEYVMRPLGLATVKDVYALYVERDSMSPKFEPGDLVFVMPHRTPRPGDYVIIQEPDTRNGEAQAYIKQLIAFTGKSVRTRQFNPPAELEFVQRPGLVVHRVVPNNELFGI